MLLLLAAFTGPETQGAGFLQLDSSGFLRRASDRADSSTTLRVGPDAEAEGRLFAGKLDVEGIAFLSDRSSFTVEAANAYVATSRKLMPHHQLTLGRRWYDWSFADEHWNLGLWTPRFLWDPLRPQPLGLSGLFYSYHSAVWRLLAFASPFSAPERGYPVRVEQGRLTSASPDHIEPYNRLLLMNQEVPIHYTLQYPPMNDLLFRPGAGVSARYGHREGIFLSGVYGVMPMHQVDLAVEPGLNPQSFVLETTIHPRALLHHLLTGEAGYRSERWSAWASVTGESPLPKSAPEKWMIQPMGPAVIGSAGAEVRTERGFAASASVLAIQETKPAQTKKNQIPLNLPSRFAYRRALQAGARWEGRSYIGYAFKWTYDQPNQSSLVALDLTYRPRPALASGGWALGLGADFFATATGKGQIGQYEGNDRVRAKVAYAF